MIWSPNPLISFPTLMIWVFLPQISCVPSNGSQYIVASKATNASSLNPPDGPQVYDSRYQVPSGGCFAPVGPQVSNIHSQVLHDRFFFFFFTCWFPSLQSAFSSPFWWFFCSCWSPSLQYAFPSLWRWLIWSWWSLSIWSTFSSTYWWFFWSFWSQCIQSAF